MSGRGGSGTGEVEREEREEKAEGEMSPKCLLMCPGGDSVINWDGEPRRRSRSGGKMTSSVLDMLRRKFLQPHI